MVDLADAASVLHEARRRAGLTQAELGRRAGVTQSVVSAYESGRRQPSLPVLLRLLRASGHVLDASLVAAEPAGLSGPLGRRVWQHRHRITAVAASHGVRRVRVFGSVARGTETPGSDVDLLVDLPEGMGLFALGPPAPRPGGERGRPHRPGAGRRPPTGRALERRDRSGDPVSRHTRQRLLDVLAALDAIDDHIRRGELSDGLVFDAVRVRLIEIGEAVKGLPADELATEPQLPWSEIARMRDHLAHRYFDTTHAIIAATVRDDLPELRRAIERLVDVAAD
jgi:uncharacterized protein with HEPN domain/transcriptional regulator with XRE-family HTH domain